MDSQQCGTPTPNSSLLLDDHNGFLGFNSNANAIHADTQATATSLQSRVSSLEAALYSIQKKLNSTHVDPKPSAMPQAQMDRLDMLVFYADLDEAQSRAGDVDAKHDAQHTFYLAELSDASPIPEIGPSRQVPRLRSRSMTILKYRESTEVPASRATKRRRVVASSSEDADAEEDAEFSVREAFTKPKLRHASEESFVDLTLSGEEGPLTAKPEPSTTTLFDFTSLIPQSKAKLKPRTRTKTKLSVKPPAPHPAEFLPTMVLTEGNIAQEDRTLNTLDEMPAKLRKCVELQYAEFKRLKPKMIHVPHAEFEVESWRKASKLRLCIYCRVRKNHSGCGLRKAEEMETTGELHTTTPCASATAHGHLTVWVEGHPVLHTHQPILILAE